MDYQSSSRSQKSRSPAVFTTASSSRQAIPTTSFSPSLRYFTAAASSSVPYESPYAQDQDRRPQPPSYSSDRSTSRSTSVFPNSSGPYTPRAAHSKQSSSSSGDSIYDPPGPRGSRSITPGGTMSTQRAMSSVSLLSHPSLIVFSFAKYINSCGIRKETTLLYICERRDVLRAKLQDPCLASALSVAPQPTHKPHDIVHFGIIGNNY
ncbi:hypothetical protein BDR22DRAFT_648038 [Usnea florida]